MRSQSLTLIKYLFLWSSPDNHERVLAHPGWSSHRYPHQLFCFLRTDTRPFFITRIFSLGVTSLQRSMQRGWRGRVENE